MNQFLRRQNQIKFLFALKPIEAWNVYNMNLMTLFTNEHACLCLICLFGFTVDNSGGSQKTERIGKYEFKVCTKVLLIIFGLKD